MILFRRAFQVIFGLVLVAVLYSAWKLPNPNYDWSSVSVETGGISLAIPHEYIPNPTGEVIKGPRHSVTLYLMYPDMRAASALERTTGHIPNSPFVIVGVSESARADYVEYMASELERLKSPKAQMQQIARSADLEALPGFEVYHHLRGQKGSFVYVKNIADEQVLALCHETALSPYCLVSFRWQKNIHVRYSFKRHLLSELDRMHSALKRRLQSFVVSNNRQPYK